MKIVVALTQQKEEKYLMLRREPINRNLAKVYCLKLSSWSHLKFKSLSKIQLHQPLFVPFISDSWFSTHSTLYYLLPH